MSFVSHTFLEENHISDEESLADIHTQGPFDGLTEDAQQTLVNDFYSYPVALNDDIIAKLPPSEKKKVQEALGEVNPGLGKKIQGETNPYITAILHNNIERLDSNEPRFEIAPDKKSIQSNTSSTKSRKSRSSKSSMSNVSSATKISDLPPKPSNDSESTLLSALSHSIPVHTIPPSPLPPNPGQRLGTDFLLNYSRPTTLTDQIARITKINEIIKLSGTYIKSTNSGPLSGFKKLSPKDLENYSDQDIIHLYSYLRGLADKHARAMFIFAGIQFVFSLIERGAKKYTPFNLDGLVVNLDLSDVVNQELESFDEIHEMVFGSYGRTQNPFCNVLYALIRPIIKTATENYSKR